MIKGYVKVLLCMCGFFLSSDSFAFGSMMKVYVPFNADMCVIVQSMEKVK